LTKFNFLIQPFNALLRNGTSITRNIRLHGYIASHFTAWFYFPTVVHRKHASETFVSIIVISFQCVCTRSKNDVWLIIVARINIILPTTATVLRTTYNCLVNPSVRQSVNPCVARICWVDTWRYRWRYMLALGNLEGNRSCSSQ
jgi:hypothetical protein